jgi:hypothetical protein
MSNGEIFLGMKDVFLMEGVQNFCDKGNGIKVERMILCLWFILSQRHNILCLCLFLHLTWMRVVRYNDPT